MSDWKPIETAPRDGTWFIIASFPAPDEFEVGCYDPSVHSKYDHVEGDLYRKRDEIGYEWSGFNNFHRATHWLALPPAPPETTP